MSNKNEETKKRERELLRKFVKKLVNNNPPSTLKSADDQKLIVYEQGPFVAVLEVAGPEEVSVVYISRIMDENIVAIIDGSGGVHIDTPGGEFKVDENINPEIYSQVVNSIEEFLKL